MRIVFAALGLLVGSAHSVVAEGPSWPIRQIVEFPAVQDIGPSGGVAKVGVTVDDDATDIEVEVYGLDGMRAADNNDVHLHADRLPAGASLDFGVTIHPGPGRSSLVVIAKAHFAHGASGGPVMDFPFGVEDAEQRAAHVRCVRQDAEGTWIRETGCDEIPPPMSSDQQSPPPGVQTAVQPSPATRSAPPPPMLTIAEIKQLAADQRVRLVGYVVDSYLCPPCPKGATCKTCIGPSALFLAETASHAPFRLSDPPADILSIAAPDPDAFARGILYRLEITTLDHRQDAVDGRLLRSQRPELEPIWNDGSEGGEVPGPVSPAK